MANYQSIAGDDAAHLLTTPVGKNASIISAEGSGIRYFLSGDTPTVSAGHLLKSGEQLVLRDPLDLDGIAFYIPTGSKLQVSHVDIGEKEIPVKKIAEQTVPINNKGVATLLDGETSVVVTHGLGVTPVAGNIMVTPIESWGSATKFWFDTITATQFTIKVDQDPGADVDFAWQANV